MLSPFLSIRVDLWEAVDDDEVAAEVVHRFEKVGLPAYPQEWLMASDPSIAQIIGDLEG
jgi:hypothetical protein